MYMYNFHWHTTIYYTATIQFHTTHNTRSTLNNVVNNISYCSTSKNIVLSRGLKTFMVLLSPLLVDVAVPSFVTLRNSTETLSSLYGVLLTGLPWTGGVICNQTAVHQGCMRHVLLTQNPNRHNHQNFLCQWNTNAPERDVGFIFRNKVKSEIRCHSN